MKISKQYTSHDSKALDRYLLEISKVDLISQDEEIKLAKEIKNGDEKAFERLVNSNLRFVVTVAKQYQNQGLSLGDLINEGNIGLIKAARRFDETRGFKFISYAVWWIRQSVLQALGENGRIVRLPLNRIGILSKIKYFNTEFEQENGREPSSSEIADKLKVDANEILEALQISSRNVSLDAPVTEGEENNLLGVLSNTINSEPDENLIVDSLKQEIESSLKSLSEREADVLKLYFGLGLDYPLTLEDIGDKFNLTRERVRQIKEKAIRRLRHKKRSNTLRKYLG
ncbi:MAG: RNA polymerase sigma factor RpoD/SigA [Bacteroidetes bacterium]|nr:RNA polymerase sigma factor RpoD/SigA [Bacteroidota bacterium]MBU1116083.1 RNA polymerase sigma factor RpoD/SigA [Bacteroidota bacterium]MBU1799493.1 RNA polymerase sigma factor RpoD/SigA [Bacteroidota bacterium]